VLPQDDWWEVLVLLPVKPSIKPIVRSPLSAFRSIWAFGAASEFSHPVVGRLWRTVSLHPHLHATLSVFPKVRTMVALVYLKEYDEYEEYGEVDRPLMLVDEHRGEQMVVDEEDDKEGQILLPYPEYLVPPEGIVSIDETYRKRYHWCQEQKRP